VSVDAASTVASAELHERLAELIERHEVPGASLAVLADGQVATAAAGVLNLDTGVEATDDSLFQIGSVTKLYTATLVMQLVDEGLVDLDVAVVEYLPELKLTDPEVTRTVTLRHLLNHTSGIAGDHFPDLGRGDDAVPRYVASCADTGQTHPLGATLSYCNAGFVIAGHLVARLREQTWDDALRSRIVEPLGLGHTFTHPDDVLRFRSAMGHLEQDGRIEPATQWGLPRSCGPAGLICATPADVVAFARMYLDGGRAPDGTQVLSPESIAAMWQAQVEIPEPYLAGTHLGVAWIRLDGEDGRIVGHNGGTIGQSTFFRLVPDAGVAIVLVLNGGHHADLWEELAPPLLDELAGAASPPPFEPPAVPVEVPLDPHVGVYERLGTRLEIERGDTGLAMRVLSTGPLGEVFPKPVAELELVPVRPDLFATRSPGERSWVPVYFYRLDDGSPYVHYLIRANPKVSDATR
jgi:CubicO group peptidase (beta-lactamase class C family)